MKDHKDEHLMPGMKWHTQDEMLALLGMHTNTLQYHRRKLHIGFAKIRGKFYYSEMDYQRFMMLFYKGPILLFWAFMSLGDSIEMLPAF